MADKYSNKGIGPGRVNRSGGKASPGSGGNSPHGGGKRKKAYSILAGILAGLACVFLLGFFVQPGYSRETYNEENPGEISFEAADHGHIVTSEETGFTYADNEILVVAAEGVGRHTIERLAEKYGARVVGCIEITGDYQWLLPGAYSEQELNDLADHLMAEDAISEATINLMLSSGIDDADATDDQKWAGLWDEVVADGENWGVEAIYGPSAWRTYNASNPKAINVGLIDSMFDSAGNVNNTYNGYTEKDKAYNGHEDLRFARTFWNPPRKDRTEGTNDRYDYGNLNHGTHVAGTFAATFNNGKGIAGVYPKGENKLYGVSFRGLNKQNGIEGNPEDIISSHLYKAELAELIARDVRVINISMGERNTEYDLPSGYIAEIWDNETARKKVIASMERAGEILSGFLNRLLKAGKDFVIVESAGNYVPNEEGAKKATGEYNFPLTCIKDENIKSHIIVVGSAGHTVKTYHIGPGDEVPTELGYLVRVDGNGLVQNLEYYRASYSPHRGRVDVMAPGEHIYSTVSGSGYEDQNPAFGTKDPYWSGTSMAAPHVTGVAAMVWSINPNLTGAQVKQIVVNSADINVEKCDRNMINASLSVAKALATLPEGNANAPKAGVIVSSVLDEGGDFLEGVSVSAVDGKGNIADTVKTDINGRFELIVPGGTYSLRFSHDDYSNIPRKGNYKNISILNGEVRYLNWFVLGKAPKDFSLPDEMVITLGEIDVIQPILDPPDASGHEFSWRSSDESVATVTEAGAVGIVTSKKKGVTTITATLDSKAGRIERTTNVRVASKGRDTILVLDVSGSMEGRPLEELRKSAIRFCDDLLIDEFNNRVGLVCYDSDVATYDLTNDLDALKARITTLSDGSRTNMQGGLNAALNMMDAQGAQNSIKNIVVMADGLPNEGAALYGGEFSSMYPWSSESGHADAVVAEADKIMSKYNLYSLGFFHSSSSEEKDFGNTLMGRLTNFPAEYHEVIRAEDLQFAFGEIADEIKTGARIVINIACPVDVTVSYDGEILSSASDSYNDISSFGNLFLLGEDKDIKVVSLAPDNEYEVLLTGTGAGEMDYLINYFDSQENMIDSRFFGAVPVTETISMVTSTDNLGASALSIDFDSDGVVDAEWEAQANGVAVVKWDSREADKLVSTDVPEIMAEDVSEPAGPVRIIREAEKSAVWLALCFVMLAMAIVFAGLARVGAKEAQPSKRPAKTMIAIGPGRRYK